MSRVLSARSREENKVNWIWNHLSWCSWYHLNILPFPQTHSLHLLSQRALLTYLSVSLLVILPPPKHVASKPMNYFWFITFLFFPYRVTASLTIRVERRLRDPVFIHCWVVLSPLLSNFSYQGGPPSNKTAQSILWTTVTAGKPYLHSSKSVSLEYTLIG